MFGRHPSFLHKFYFKCGAISASVREVGDGPQQDATDILFKLHVGET